MHFQQQKQQQQQQQQQQYAASSKNCPETNLCHNLQKTTEMHFFTAILYEKPWQFWTFLIPYHFHTLKKLSDIDTFLRTFIRNYKKINTKAYIF